jgi:hypothetical protein
LLNGMFGGDIAVSATQVLHECMTGGERPSRAVAFESAHRAQPGFEPVVVSLDWIVRVLLDGVHGLRQQLIQHPRVARRPVGRDLYRRRAYLERLDEERPRRGQIPLDCQKDMSHLAVLVDRAVQVSPTTGDFEVGLVEEPAIPWDMPTMPGGVDKFRCEALHPPIHRHVINGDAALGQQLLDIAIADSPQRGYQRTATAITARGKR